VPEPSSSAPTVFRRFAARRRNVAGLAGLGALLAIALFADFLASDRPMLGRVGGELVLFANLRDADAAANQPGAMQARCSERRWVLMPPVSHSPTRIDLGTPSPAPPSREHLLGTDEVGRDVLARLIHGTRVSLSVGLLSVALFVLLGTLLGGLAGYFGGVVDGVVNRAVETLLAVPWMLLVLAFLAVVERPSVGHLILVIGLTRWPEVARLVRAEVARLRSLEFVAAARMLGLRESRVLFRHVLPNALGPVLVSAAFGVATVVATESGLSFLGLGAPPPTPNWGEMLGQAHRYLTHPGAWWLAVGPGAAILITVLCCNLVGEGLREALEPSSQRPPGA